MINGRNPTFFTNDKNHFIVKKDTANDIKIQLNVIKMSISSVKTSFLIIPKNIAPSSVGIDK